MSCCDALAEKFGGNPFHILEDVWYGGNKHGTGWTMRRIHAYGNFCEEQGRRRDLQPKSAGGIFIDRFPYKPEWTEEDEKEGA